MAFSLTPTAGAVVGGTRVSIRSAPWTVLVRQAIGNDFLICTGAVLDRTHVVTAAHCIFTPNNRRAAVMSVSVAVGISNFASRVAGDALQRRNVSATRVDPGYLRSRTVADDVAVLTLAQPLDLARGTVVAASLPAANSSIPAGKAGELFGFGRESGTSQPNGSLNELRLTIDPKGTRGTNHSTTVMPRYAANAFCASSPSGAICLGDSGAALVRPGTRTIIGIASGGPEACAPGNHSIYGYAASGEILAFIRSAER